MPCDFCTTREACDARDDSIQALQLRHCKEAEEPRWESDEALTEIYSGEDDGDPKGGTPTESPKKEKPSGKPRRKSQTKKRKSGNRIGICLNRENEKTIIGRGLCGNCYGKAKKAGTLPPLKDESARKKPEAPQEKPEQKATMPDVSDVRGAFRPDQAPDSEILEGKSANVTIQISAGPLSEELGQAMTDSLKQRALSDRSNPGCNHGDFPGSISLAFDGSERDQALLKSIIEHAELHRRTPDQEVLWIVQNALEAKEQVLRGDS